MIRFSCYCGHQFALDDSQAAGTVQCPDCRKLNDVPTHQDLANLDEEGVIQLKPVEVEEQPNRLAELSLIYTRSRKDDSGNDIDFRPTAEELAQRGIPAEREPAPVVRPRYDPETGQLVRPIEVAPLPPRKAMPVKAPSLNYARRDTPQTVSLSATELARPINIFAMLWVMLVMFVAGAMAMLVLTPFPTPTGPPSHMLVWLGPMIILELLVLSHYGHVIEELGPLSKDDLPRMLGDLNFYENIWSPLGAVIWSVLLCYGPAALAFNIPVPMLAIPVGSLLAGAGTYFFPAIMLVLTTSGTISNLRPDRVMGTISTCGPSYLWCVFTWILAGLVYLLAFIHFVEPALGHLAAALDHVPTILTSLIILPVVHVLTVPFAHIFAWHTGMLYRRYYDSFPWVGQRHEKQVALAKKI